MLHEYEKALDQEPCEDANANQHNSNELNDVGQRTNALEGDVISRQAVNELQKYRLNCGNTTITCVSLNSINELPPVTPQQKYEDIAKAFQFGLAFGFGEKHDEVDKVIDEIKKVITPQPKTGHWIGDAKTYYEELNKRGLCVDEYTPYFTDDIACSECLAKYSMLDNETQFFKHCPNCGCRMVEPQESEG